MRWLPAAYAICPHTLASRLSPSQEEAPNLQWREFALVYIAYMGFLVSRKNYGFWLRPGISELGYAKGQAGLIGSTLEVTYGTCSFLNGVVIDSRSPKHLLIGGLLLSALANLCVAGTESLPLMVVVWGLNGAVQSVGWPSVTNVFLAWFPDPAARGAWYSLLSTCQNAGAALVPLLVSAFVSLYGWRAALYAPAVASVCIALLLGLCLYGSPAAAANAEPSLKAKPSPADLAHTMRQQVRATLPLLCTRQISHSQNPRPHPSPLTFPVWQVFLNPALWLMAASYFGCSMVRTCLQDWTSLYLHEAKGMPIATSARCLFLWELGGFAGTFAAGFISDRVFGGRRGPVVCICCALLAPSLVLLLHTTSPGLVQVRHARQTAALTLHTPHHTRPPQTSSFPLSSSPLSSVACPRGAICGWGSAPSQCTCCSASSLARPCRPPSPPPPAVSSR